MDTKVVTQYGLQLMAKALDVQGDTLRNVLNVLMGMNTDHDAQKCGGKIVETLKHVEILKTEIQKVLFPTVNDVVVENPVEGTVAAKKQVKKPTIIE
jgi:hypothetical protein